jgi:nucleoid DNA-binding protein
MNDKKIFQDDILKLIQAKFINSKVFLPADCSREKCRKIFNVVVDVFAEILSRYGDQDLSHTLRFGKLGAFKIATIKERIGYNIKTKETTILPSIKNIRFRYSRNVKNKLNKASE